MHTSSVGGECDSGHCSASRVRLASVTAVHIYLQFCVYFLPSSISMLERSIATLLHLRFIHSSMDQCGWWRWSLQRQQCEEVSDDPLLGPPPPFLPILGRVIFVERYETFCMMEVLNRSQRHICFTVFFDSDIKYVCEEELHNLSIHIPELGLIFVQEGWRDHCSRDFLEAVVSQYNTQYS